MKQTSLKIRGKTYAPVEVPPAPLSIVTHIPLPEQAKFPAAPRAIKNVTGISQAAKWCWKVAETAYNNIGYPYVKPWNALSVEEQDRWYWKAKAVMQALDTLE